MCVLRCSWAQVTGCRKVPPLLARKFWPCLSLVKFGCLGPCSVTSFAPISFPSDICQQLPALCVAYIHWITLLHFSLSRYSDCNEFRPPVKTISRSKVMTQSGIQNCVILEVAKNLFSFLCSEFLRCSRLFSYICSEAARFALIGI